MNEEKIQELKNELFRFYNYCMDELDGELIEENIYLYLDYLMRLK